MIMYRWIALMSVLLSFPAVAQTTVKIGSGGGITGTATEYKITSGGEVLKGTGIGKIAYTEHSKMRKRVARGFVKKVTELLPGISLTNPGNMYYYIAIDEQHMNVTWGGGEPAPEAIKTLYQQMMTKIKTLHFTTIPH